MAHVFSLTGIIITACGGLGAVGRYLLERHLKGNRGWTPMRAVSAVNLLGCALLGLFSGVIIALSEVPSYAPSETHSGGVMLSLAVAATALCGGFTTFSTAMVEAVREPRGMRNAGTTLAVVLVGCIIAFSAMMLLGFMGTAAACSVLVLPS